VLNPEKDATSGGVAGARIMLRKPFKAVRKKKNPKLNGVVCPGDGYDFARRQSGKLKERGVNCSGKEVKEVHKEVRGLRWECVAWGGRWRRRHRSEKKRLRKKAVFAKKRTTIKATGTPLFLRLRKEKEYRGNQNVPLLAKAGKSFL